MNENFRKYIHFYFHNWFENLLKWFTLTHGINSYSADFSFNNMAWDLQYVRKLPVACNSRSTFSYFYKTCVRGRVVRTFAVDTFDLSEVDRSMSFTWKVLKKSYKGWSRVDRTLLEPLMFVPNSSWSKKGSILIWFKLLIPLDGALL